MDDHFEEMCSTGQTQSREVEDDAELLDELRGAITHIGGDAEACSKGSHQNPHDNRSASQSELDRHTESGDS